MNKKEIGLQIKKYRKLAHYTQAQLAEKVGIHEKQISRIESGIHFPTFDNFIKILEVLNMDFKDFEMKVPSNIDIKKRITFLLDSMSEDKLKKCMAIMEIINKD